MFARIRSAATVAAATGAVAVAGLAMTAGTASAAPAFLHHSHVVRTAPASSQAYVPAFRAATGGAKQVVALHG